MFAGAEAPLSNFHPCTITSNELVDDRGTPIKFTSSEQLYQYNKTRFGQDETSAKLILNTEFFFQIKQLGKGIKLPDEPGTSFV